MMSIVLQFVRPQDKAKSRGRNEALSVIVPRLRELYQQSTCLQDKENGRIFNQVTVDGLVLTFTPNSAGMYFRIDDYPQGRYALVMSGYLDPTPPGKYLNGKLHLMSWKRGDWITRLFSAPTPGETPIGVAG